MTGAQTTRGIAPDRPLPGTDLFFDTVRALVTTRRLVAIVLVCVPLLFAQYEFSRTPAAVPLGLLLALTFVVVAPFSIRVLLVRGDYDRRLLVRALALIALAGLAPFVGYVLPKLFHIGETFLTRGVNLFVSSTLFWVGGWGLARDIELESDLARETARAEALALEAERAQFLALRAHLDPHFLFNTLNAIAEWCREDGAVAERAVLDLSSLLREMLAGVRAPSWPLSRELALIRGVFELHKIRDPERFAIEWSVPPDLPEVAVPPLLALPVAENAMKHGPAAGHRGPVSVSLDIEGDAVLLRIENPGPFQGRREHGEGVAMVEKRIALAYRGRARFEIREHGGRTIAELTLPLSGPDAGRAA